MSAKRILIIDDNRDGAHALQRVLELSGYKVQLAYDAQQGIAHAHQDPPDVVLCDIGLPGKEDGYSVAQALRENSHQPAPLLVAVTGYGHPGSEERSRAAGFDVHLIKPVDANLLCDLIARRSVNA